MLSNGSAHRLVVDTGPLIYISRIDALDLFNSDEPAHISDAVHREAVLPQAAYRFPEIAAIETAIRAGRIKVSALRPDEREVVLDLGRRMPGLGLGERGTIAVASSRGWSAVLFDRQAGRIAQSLGVRVVGIVELLFWRTADEALLESRIRRFAALVEMRIEARDQLLERVKERSRW